MWLCMHSSFFCFRWLSTPGLTLAKCRASRFPHLRSGVTWRRTVDGSSRCTCATVLGVRPPGWLARRNAAVAAARAGVVAWPRSIPLTGGSWGVPAAAGRSVQRFAVCQWCTSMGEWLGGAGAGRVLYHRCFCERLWFVLMLFPLLRRTCLFCCVCTAWGIQLRYGKNDKGTREWFSRCHSSPHLFQVGKQAPDARLTSARISHSRRPLKPESQASVTRTPSRRGPSARATRLERCEQQIHQLSAKDDEAESPRQEQGVLSRA